VNRRNRQTLVRIFETPTVSGLRWQEVERLLKALGAMVQEGQGSRVRVALEGAVMVIHRPHPKPELRKYQVEAVREFLAGLGQEPEDD
jgi:hypothetical protein